MHPNIILLKVVVIDRVVEDSCLILDLNGPMATNQTWSTSSELVPLESKATAKLFAGTTNIAEATHHTLAPNPKPR